MIIRDTPERYGIVSQSLHWGMAAGIIALFGLGWWMVRLDYYDDYYTRAPALHRSIGMLMMFALILRIAWRIANRKPAHPDLTPFERKASSLVHFAFYPLLLVLTMSGYLISTGDGRAIDVFDWFAVPSVLHNKSIAVAAGPIHRWMAYTVMILAGLHASAAIRHAVTRYRFRAPAGSDRMPPPISDSVKEAPR